MPTQHLFYYFSIILLTLFLSDCQKGNNKKNPSNIEPINVGEIELFADFEQHGLARPVQIESLPNSKIALLDNQTNKILILNSKGELLNSFGGEGKGPGETLNAMQLQKSNDYLYVIDSNLRSINQFSHIGDYIRSFNFDTGRFRPYVTVMNEASYFRMAMGKSDKLIGRVDAKTDSAQYFGKALGKEYLPTDLEAERKILQKGEIPEFMRNQVTMYYSDDYLYVFLNVYSRLQKYTKEGKLLWDQVIDMPVNQAIFDKVVERAHDPESRFGVPVLRYILSMKVADGKPYLLWYPVDEHPQLLVKTDDNGKLETVYHIEDEEFIFFDFSIDSQNDFLYLIEETGQVYRTKLPN